MANHVSGYLSIRTISDEGQLVWEKICNDLEAKKDESDYEIHLGYHIFEDDGEGGFKDWDFNRMCDEIGAKWAYATDMDECGMAMYSAWSPCREFAADVAERIGEVDSNIAIVLTYEDEFPNFVGVATFNKDGIVEDNVLDCDELMDIMKEQEPRLVELWNEEKEEWDNEEEAWDIIYEIQWDIISDWQNANEEW